MTNIRNIKTYMKRSLLGLALMGTTVSAWAQTTYVAKIGDTQYETLQAAIDAANAATGATTITLLQNVAVSSTMLISKDLTIDGTKDSDVNYTITSSVNNKLGAFYVNANTCNFTIKNTTIDGNNTGTMAVCAYRGVPDTTAGTVPSGDVQHSGNAGNIITLEDCTVKNFTGWPSSYVGAVYGFAQSTVKLTRCTFSGNTTSKSQDANSASGADVWVGAAGNLIISGGSFQELFANSNSTENVTVNISGGAQVAELSICVSYKADGSTYIPAITIDNATVTDLKTEEADTPIPANSIITQNGGTVTNKPATEVAKILNGTATKAFASVDAAITAATADQTITLIADLAADLTITTDKTVSIDLGTHLGSYNLTFTGTGTLTIVNGTVSGTITNSGTGTLVITGGSYAGTITKTNGTIAISGGTFTQKPADDMIASGSEVMVTADDKYEVAVAGTAEAQIGDLKYKTIGKAILTAGATETTIKLLKDVAADITIPANAKITFDADGVTISKPITVATGGRLNLTNGTFTGTITNDGTLNLSGDVVLYVKPTGDYTCTPAGYDLVVDANGHYVVGDVANAEAQIGTEKYMTIADAITVAGSTSTTITLLKDPAADITIPTGAEITLEIQNVATTFDTLTKAITVNGTLAITSGTISGAITIADADGKIKITEGVTLTNTSVALSDALATDNVLKSNTNDATPAVTSYWVEKKFEAKVDPSITGDDKISAATTLAGNNAIFTGVTLAENQSLIITVKDVTLSGSDVKSATFDVKLIGADGVAITDELSTAVGFNLPILFSTALNNPWVNLWHDGAAITGTNNIQGSGNGQYIALSSNQFSPFSYDIIEDPIAQIGETKYETVAKAITAATTGETEIKLLQDVTTNIDITSSTTNVKLTIGTHTVSGNITNAGTLTLWDGTNSGGTNGVISGTITNTGTLKISGDANVSGSITANDGTVTISGGTVSAVTTNGTAALTISGGIVGGDLAVGGTGANTITGGTFTAAVTTSQNTTISGGTFSSTSTITNNGGTLTITGGTHEYTTAITNTSGTVAISGGTHRICPDVTLCATGYMPVKNDDNATYGMTNEWLVVDDTDLSKNTHLEGGTYSVATAKYNRNSGMVSAGNAATKYGTICLPFAITAQPTGMTLYKATSISGNTLTITAVTYTTPIPAGTPLIFELSEAAKTLTVTSSNATVKTTAPATTADNDNLLIGTYSGATLTTGLENIYYLNGDAFHQAVTSLTVPKFRAYLYYEAPTPTPKPSMLNIVKDDEEEDVTGISQTMMMDDVNAVYDMSGKKLNGLQKGVNIVRRADGSKFKVVVK